MQCIGNGARIVAQTTGANGLKIDHVMLIDSTAYPISEQTLNVAVQRMIRKIKATMHALCFVLLLPACASTKVGSFGIDERGRPVPIPGIGVGGDVIGDVTLRIDGHGLANIDVKTPPALTEMPVMRVAVLDRKGTTILGYNEIPMMTGIYHGRVNDGMWAGMSKLGRSLSNLAGTVLSGWLGIEFARNPGGNVLGQ